jgi:hypothetical protein
LQKIAELEEHNKIPQKLRAKQNFQKSPKISELEGTKNPPPSKNSRYRQKLLSWRVGTKYLVKTALLTPYFQNMIAAKSA